EVARLANDTVYGLGASIWTRDVANVVNIVPKIRAGTVWVNCHNILDGAMPFGGYKQSGFGKDMGKEALEAYLETKSVCIMA
ncbi:Aldehyde dehydrogenase, partial [hydrothermal vent metagenome]